MTMTADDVTPRSVLPEGRFAGPMPWIIAIMICLSVLAATAGLAIARSSASLTDALGRRVTIQIVEANADQRVAQRIAIERALRRGDIVRDVAVIGDDKVRAMLQPWLGDDGADGELPIPSLIDATLTDGSRVEDVARLVAGIAPGARVDRHATWLGPLADLLTTMTWLAAAVVGMTAAGSAAAVVLGARAAFDQHRATIDVMHLMGATDRQVSRLFERRVAQDAVTGAALGSVVACAIAALVAWRLSSVGSQLISGGMLNWLDLLFVACLPLVGVGVAIVAARVTVLRALARVL